MQTNKTMDIDTGIPIATVAFRKGVKKDGIDLNFNRAELYTSGPYFKEINKIKNM